MAEKENQDPSSSKKKKLSLSLGKNKRFKKVSPDELKSLEKKQVPKTTAASTRWAFKIFRDWVHDFNKRSTTEKCPESVLSSSCTREELNKWLTLFVAEVRNQSGEPYPPRTLNLVLSGICRHMRSENPEYPNFMFKTDTAFTSFRIALDNICKHLSADGVGADSLPTERISIEEENRLWESGTLNTGTLLRAVFYGIGKCFCLRGGQEHRDLTLSHFKRLKDPDRYIYNEHVSKNRPGGLDLLRVDHKSVSIVANQEAGERCLVSLLDKYIKKLPQLPQDDDRDFFYFRPLPYTPTSECAPWYTASPVGKNLLGKMVKEMCAEADIEGKKTNHSLRVTGVSCLFDASVPEKIIQQRSGHRSLDGLRVYERITEEQKMAVSKILTNSDASNFDETLKTKNQPVTNGLPLDQKPGDSACGASSGCSYGNQYNNCQVNVYSAPAFSPYGSYPPPHNTWPSPCNTGLPLTGSDMGYQNFTGWPVPNTAPEGESFSSPYTSDGTMPN